jgi:GTPase SAR1 family protein
VVYDIMDIDSFEKAQVWVKELKMKIGNEAPIIIAGNKCDVDNA